MQSMGLQESDTTCQKNNTYTLQQQQQQKKQLILGNILLRNAQNKQKKHRCSQIQLKDWRPRDADMLSAVPGAGARGQHSRC